MALVTTTVTLADPAVFREPGPAVDTADDPASLAVAALAQTRHRDYTVTMVRTPSDGRVEFPLRLEMDNTDREYAVRRPDDPSTAYDDVVEYGNPYGSWAAFVPEPGPAAWRSDSREWGDVHLFGGPFELEARAVKRVRSNDSTVVLNVTDAAAVYRLFFHAPNATDRRPGLRAHAVVAVNRTAGAPRRVTVVTVEPTEDGGSPVRTRTVMRFHRWDATDVSRPDTIPYTATEIAEDVAEIDGRLGVTG